MSNKDVAEREADLKGVNELEQLKDQDCQINVVGQLGQLKDTYYQTDIW